MYYDYFGLNQPPFRITPDTSLFFPGGDRGAVLDALIYAILNGEGMVKVVGEVGSGKTMLCRMLEKELPEKVEVVYLANPSLSPENILQAIAFELKIPVTADSSRLQVMHNLQEYLLKRHAENRQVVVFVEEAQAMPVATLEEIRLLSNLETQQSKLLQIALFGQPELDALIAKPEIRQLKERITYSFQLNPFKSEHIRDYLNSRLRASGYRSGEIFDKAAVRKIEQYSKGLLRRVNILADKSMLAAYAANTNRVGAKHVRQAARDSEFINSNRIWLWRGLVTASLLLIALITVAVLQHRQATTIARAGHNARLEKGDSPAAERGDKTPVKAQGDASIVSAHSGPSSLKTVAPTDDRRLIRDMDSESAELRRRQTPKASGTVDPGSATVPTSGPESTTIRSAREENRDLAAAEQGREQALLDGQLLGLRTLYELQDLGDARLSSKEAAILRRQLRELPPEVALYQDSAQFSDICRLCWSILYRPVTDPENL